MLSITRSTLFAGVIVLTGVSNCLADPVTGTRCPSDLHGRPPLPSNMVQLFYNDPRDNMLLAPSESHGQTNTWWQNVWTFKPGSASTVTVFCRYAGTREQVVFKLPASVRICRQDPASFACE